MEQVELDAVSERIELAVAGKLPERFNLAGLVETAMALGDE
jgi:Fe-S cluster assembly protein SufD